jgi:hypothetical protein
MCDQPARFKVVKAKAELPPGRDGMEVKQKWGELGPDALELIDTYKQICRDEHNVIWGMDKGDIIWLKNVMQVFARQTFGVNLQQCAKRTARSQESALSARSRSYGKI